MARANVSFRHLFTQLDWFTVVVYLLLLAAGCLCVIGACYNYGDMDILDFSLRSGKQITWIGCSLVLALMILLIDDRVFDTFANVIYLAFMLLLLVTPFLATDHKGSYSWITVGSLSIQPAEFAKCATALALAKLMGTYGFNLQRTHNFARAVFLVVLPLVLIILQKETGSALVYLAFFVVFYREGMSGSVLFVGFAAIVYFVVGLRYDPFQLPHTTATVGEFVVQLLVWVFTAFLFAIYQKERKLLWKLLGFGVGLTALSLALSDHVLPAYNVAWVQLVICVVFVVALLVHSFRFRQLRPALIALFAVGSLALHFSSNYVLDDVLAPHQQVRIRVLLGLEDDVNGAGYNVHQSEIAIGSGGLTGKGFLNGTQTKLKYVPEQDTDFIFCTVGEEHGFVGSALVLLLFLTLILRLIYLAERQTYAFGRVYGYCVVSIFLFHLIINVGMVIGLTPVIGIPLPFFSYGGSSLWGFTLLLFIFLRIDLARGLYRRDR